ncbi:organic solute transporter Ostalpha-domain-containing protein [Vararia minispora EC-137]|uniref:Organic solute transporter Ostalpha-domain-containing protein n=1 Tax=Vararia minispora EC-137 TaxID=1314806 RepID=A0ACB8QZZ3_9AGAM|nr:organic solute transporter Ostalpha-domain-containing protein [Vararia minispora EC-137]
MAVCKRAPHLNSTASRPNCTKMPQHSFLPMAGGSGSSLNPVILALAGSATVVATLLSALSVYLHLKNYRKPFLQRMVIRIMIMVPLYAISSLISLFSLEAAFVIDALRDIYEAFVIYCFFQLLLSFLGGERSLLILVHGRPPKNPPFPTNVFQPELDVSDPYTFLFLKRGIMQYVQVKPVLAAVTLILKAVGKYNEGNLRPDSGYLYVSIVYNASICLSLYCLAMFWLSISQDLKPFRPVPKFLCVKGILFFSFWQSILVSILVSAGAIKQLGPYTDVEHISLGLTDLLICLEMPFFAVAHWYAFSHRDYIDSDITFVGRMPIRYAVRDAFGYKDVFEDMKSTLRGEGMDYREFEPSEGFIHQGLGRERRIKAGLRYSKGGRGKYWLPQPTTSTVPGRTEHVVDHIMSADSYDEVHAPLLGDQAEHVIHDETYQGHATVGYELPFGSPDVDDDTLFSQSKQYLFGDYLYPCIDASTEEARRQMWEDEERILRDERSAWDSDFKGHRRAAQQARTGGYGAVVTSQRPIAGGSGSCTNSNSDRNSHPDSPHVEDRHIDMESDHMLSADPHDVKLRWTAVGRMTPSPKPSPRSLQPPRLAPVSRTQSHRSRPSSAISESPPVQFLAHADSRNSRPDAIDLVVEDSRLAIEEVARERRHGEPAVRGSGLRKVFRRHNLPGERDEIGEIGEATIRASVHTDLEEVARVMAEEEPNQEGPSLPRDLDVLRAKGPVATVEEPPAHVYANSFSPPPDDENPWA